MTARYKCPECGGRLVHPDDFEPGIDSYHDTTGGHADRHTRVVEAAERVLNAALLRGDIDNTPNNEAVD